MAYVLPTFNLTCNIFRNGGWYPSAVALSPICNLAYSRRVQIGQTPTVNAGISLLLPPGTDIRSTINAVTADNVEVPAGSLRAYTVEHVEDVGKGFPNEHRVAILFQNTIPGGTKWPAPMP